MNRDAQTGLAMPGLAPSYRPPAARRRTRRSSCDVVRSTQASPEPFRSGARGLFTAGQLQLELQWLAKALKHIDAESTCLDLDAAAEADLRALGFNIDYASAADPAEVFDADASVQASWATPTLTAWWIPCGHGWRPKRSSGPC